MITFSTVLGRLFDLLKSSSPTLSLVFSLGTLGLAVFTFVNQMWATLFAKIDGLVAPAMGNADFSGLGMINYIFPLDTVCTYISAFMLLRVTCAVIRIIKSFIPTVA